ncbi:haloacid dehalogenase type II [Dankookia sp. GCM10030260]|uniref:haloacid dehalogenase type II n=1 Tax=Dankookia sp. GCM10030260 TaxID=3273390 RepID=UPI003623606F
MTRFDTVKALVFDVFGTVVDWREGIARDAAPVLAQLGRRDIDPRAFADAWRKRYQPAMEECRSGRRAWTRLDVLHRENLDGVLQDHGIDPAQLGEAALDDLNRAWHRLDPWPEAVAGLTRLKRKFIIAPLSNGNIALMTNMAKRAGIPWDAILGAEVVQAYKPQPEAYTRTAEVLGIRPSELCLVAAHNGDLKAARAVGLATAFVPRPTEHGPGQSGDLAPSEAWDAVGRDFQDLAAKLGC